MGIEMAEMKFRVNAVWNKQSGFKDYTKQEAGVDSKKQKSKAKLIQAKKSKKAQKVTDVEMEEEPEEELELN